MASIGLAAVAVVAIGCVDTIVPAVDEAEGVSCLASDTPPAFPGLPDRLGPPAVTTGSVPHQQINPNVIPEVIDEMAGRIFSLTSVESRVSTIVDGATAIWLRDDVTLARPECVVREREVGHIHPDGSIHVTLPHGRIPGAEAAGWVEGHPWADTRPGFEAYVMIFTPQDLGELDVIVDLVALGIDFVEGS
jgi:phospholipase/carboxylesterase